MSLGAPIEAGKNLYTDLQKVYIKTKESYEQLRVRTEERSSYEKLRGRKHSETNVLCHSYNVLEKNASLGMGYEFDIESPNLLNKNRNAKQNYYK